MVLKMFVFVCLTNRVPIITIFLKNEVNGSHGIYKYIKINKHYAKCLFIVVLGI